MLSVGCLAGAAQVVMVAILIPAQPTKMVPTLKVPLSAAVVRSTSVAKVVVVRKVIAVLTMVGATTPTMGDTNN